MRRDHVIGFHEGFLCNFPIAGQLFGDVHGLVATFEGKGCPVFVNVPQELLEGLRVRVWVRSEEHTSELQSLMRISYAVFCLKKKTPQRSTTSTQSQFIRKYHQYNYSIQHILTH